MVGTFGTLMGAGGGFVLVPVLLLLYPERSPETITSMSLLVVCANATSGSLAYARQKRIDYQSGWWFALGTLPGAILGAFTVGFIPTRAFDGVFAVVLLSLGLYLMFRSVSGLTRELPKGRGIVHRQLRDADGNTFVYSFQLWKGVAISVGVGFISSLLGIGGGIIHVPVMATVLHFPVHVAAATSHFVLALMAAEGTAVHLATGALKWDSALGQAVLIGIGAIPGAQLGAVLARRVHGKMVIRALAGALMLVGLRLGLLALQG